MQNSITSQIASTEFLQLLTLQLQHQDPMDPVKQENFISQLTQFSMLEGTENLNTSFQSMLKLQEISQGIDLAGKNVSYIDPTDGSSKSGRVDESYVDNGSIMLMINGRAISVNMVMGVKAI
jgi:flagellar basal-body rod modification protein FlgD